MDVANPLPIPEDLRAEVEDARRLGTLIYLHDRAAAIATDVMFAHIRSPEAYGIGGYLTLPTIEDRTPETWQVPFFTREDSPRIACQVYLSRARDERPRFQAFDPPAPASADVRLLMLARRTAIAAIGPPQQPLNPVVLPGDVIGSDGILVYLIASARDPNVVVLGRHFRILVSSDGRTVAQHHPMSKSILELPASDPPAGTQRAGAWITHLVSACPTEAHVFTSLLHRMPIHVGTSRGQWAVEGDRISLLQEGTAEKPDR
jgi:hypothetical protein